MTRTRWGILGTGKIAGAFARGLGRAAGARLVAVGSRRQETADRFGDEHGVARRHASYEALAADPEVEAVYVATPHTSHRDDTLLCLESGKAVLCEKPLAVNAAQAREMVAAARERRLFLMEAIWTCFLPAVLRLRELLASGDLGEPRMVRADFCFRAERRPGSRLFEPSLAGGALLDLGIYTLLVADEVFARAPERIATLAHLGPTGVDERSGVVLDYGAGRLAIVTSSNRLRTPNEALVAGTAGWARLHDPFWHPQRLTVAIGDRRWEEDHPYEGNGYPHEAAEVGRCLAAGRTESEILPLDRSLRLMETMDRIRAEWGLRYPAE
ncbi:MAG: Gfo/Idh/MocA family oxidoreductase [Thermoanaerobaculia bacterium]|nr:Gfo/Idh/MocA family oxidoreductase [Thermoanaerobaculia bacterium]